MKDYVKLNKEVYDRLAEEYKRRLPGYIESDREVTAFFIDYLKNNFNVVRVLELGPGSGLMLKYFENEGFEPTAIDISENIIRVAGEVTLKTKYIHADFMEYDFEYSKFEGIFAKAFIHLFPKVDAIFLLNKIKGLLTQNGVLFLATTMHLESEEGYFEKSDYPDQPTRFRKKWTEDELIDLLISLKFEVINKSYNIEEDKNKKWVNFVVRQTL